MSAFNYLHYPLYTPNFPLYSNNYSSPPPLYSYNYPPYPYLHPQLQSDFVSPPITEETITIQTKISFFN